MTKRIVGFLTIMCCLNAFSTTINLQGKITKEGSDAVEGALVFLKSYPGITTLSGSDGAFTLSGNTRVLIDPWMKGMNGIALRSMKRGAGILVRTNSNQSNMKIDIYKINGGLMASKQLQGKSAGEYAVPFSNTANDAYIVKVAFGNESRIFKAVPGMGLSCAMISEAQGVKSAGLGKAGSSFDIVDLILKTNREAGCSTSRKVR